MYLSHPVRRIREDPAAGETVSLVLELADDDRYDALVSAADDLDGSVDRDLGFAAHLVTVPETAVDDLCDFDGVERIETADTISLDFDPETVDTDE